MNDKALFHNKESLFKKGSNAAVIGYSRNISDATSKALDFAAGARLQKSINEAEYKRKMGFTGDALNRSRTAGRNQFLELANKNRQIEYNVNKTWSLGMDKAELGAERVLAGNRDKLLASKGIAPQRGPRISIPKSQRDYMGTFNKIKTAGALIAAPFTGGASLSILGIGGIEGSASGGNLRNTLF